MGVGMGFGLVLPMVEGPLDGVKPTWLQIRSMAERAEQCGFDTVWTADEIVWRNPDWPGPRGWWECLSTTSSLPETFGPMTSQLDRICEDIGRDPGSIGRSVGVTRVELLLYPNTVHTLEQLAPALTALV